MYIIFIAISYYNFSSLYRLTVLVDMCRQTVLCIRPRSANMNIPTEAPTSDSRSGSGSGEFLSSGLDNLEDEDKTPVIPADVSFFS